MAVIIRRLVHIFLINRYLHLLRSLSWGIATRVEPLDRETGGIFGEHEVV